jgi:hypothetical protein
MPLRTLRLLAASQPSAAFKAAAWKRSKFVVVRALAGSPMRASKIAATSEGPVDVHLGRNVEHIRSGVRSRDHDGAPQLDLHVAGLGLEAV